MTDKSTHSRLNDDFNLVAGHLSVDQHTHIHFHKGELRLVGRPFIPGGSLSTGTDYELLVRNPSGSGYWLEVIQAGATSSVEHWKMVYEDFPWPSSGTSANVHNPNDGEPDAAGFDAKYGEGIIDTANAETVPSEAVAGSGNKAGGEVSTKVTHYVDEGNTFGQAVQVDSNTGRLAQNWVVAWYEKGRDLERD